MAGAAQGLAPGAADAARVAAIDRLDAALPQTQCTRCGYPDCRSYAEAIVRDGAAINRCPPGGAEGVQRLAALSGRPVLPLDPACGEEGPLRLARIDEAWCIGCTLCIAACPVDCIIGASKQMHTVIAADCTGCALCLPACPVDCITLDPPADAASTGWAAWSPARAEAARQAHAATRQRRAQRETDHAERQAARAQEKLATLDADPRLAAPGAVDRKRAAIEAALARVRAQAGG